MEQKLISTSHKTGSKLSKWTFYWRTQNSDLQHHWKYVLISNASVVCWSCLVLNLEPKCAHHVHKDTGLRRSRDEIPGIKGSLRLVGCHTTPTYRRCPTGTNMKDGGPSKIQSSSIVLNAINRKVSKGDNLTWFDVLCLKKFEVHKLVADKNLPKEHCCFINVIPSVNRRRSTMWRQEIPRKPFYLLKSLVTRGRSTSSKKCHLVVRTNVLWPRPSVGPSKLHFLTCFSLCDRRLVLAGSRSRAQEIPSEMP